MSELTIATLAVPAFIAGVLTFLAPCTLPLVPGYLSFISGSSLKDLQHSDLVKTARKKILLNGLFFVFGFSLVFITLGALAGFAGRLVAQYRPLLARVGGVFVIIFGLFMLHAIKIPWLTANRQFPIPKIFQQGRPINSLILGATFGFGWTPCVGPILASVLLLASTTATLTQGIFLLAIFSLGLAIPFLVIALSVSRAVSLIHRASAYLNIISLIGGVFLVFLGVLMVTGRFGIWVGWFYRYFDFINYEKLLDYL